MPTIPDHRIHFETPQELCALFRAFQQDHRAENSILSVSLTLPAVDPLLGLDQRLPLQTPHFYFEKDGQACLALDPLLSFEVSGSDRYQRVRQFIQQTSRRVCPIGQTAVHTGQPRFFCGFTFFPNVPQTDYFPAASVMLPRWQISRWQQQSVLTANVLVDDRFSPEASAQEIWHMLQHLRQTGGAFYSVHAPAPELLKYQPVATEKQFELAVLEALAAIAQHQCHKIVLAHAVDITLSRPIPWIQAIHNLRDTHPNCYIFSSSNDEGTLFLGASPEKLASVQGTILQTDALAGSAPRGGSEVEELHLAKDLLANTKERLEHQVVIDFIQQRLRQLGMTPQFLPTQLLQLANIQHLHTPLQAMLPEPLHLLDVVAALHPTPAVAGFPQQIACDYIQHHETFSRSRYAAPVGWVDLDGNGEFAVGIRSAIIQKATARLFAGAGIVAGSNPTQEFSEIQLKLQALLSTFTEPGL
jgi:menaquinone-specific isochorismate synthase